MQEKYIELLGLISLAIAASLVGLFLKNSTKFADGLRTMLGGSFFGALIAYLLHDSDFGSFTKRTAVMLTAIFAKPIYEKLTSRAGFYIDKLLLTLIENLRRNNYPNDFNPPSSEDQDPENQPLEP